VVVTICLESHLWTLITDYWRFSSFFKTCNLFQSNWNFILFHICTMNIAPNSNIFYFTSIFYVDKTDVTICLESPFWTLITDYWRFSSFFKTCNLFQSNWNFTLFHMYNEISTKFQHFFMHFQNLGPFIHSNFVKIIEFCQNYHFV
jgi:hypothetical protein